MSDISSAGRNGKTYRRDVLRGVDIPVVPGAAGRTVPCPCAEGQLREQVPAFRAGLAALTVGTGDFSPGLGPVRRALLAAGQAPLVPGQAAFPPGQAARVRDLVPVAGDGEVREAQVHADSSAGRGKRGGRGHVDGEGDVPAPARIAGDRHRGRVERRRVDVRPRPGEGQRRAHPGEERPPVAVPEPRAGVLGVLPSAAGLVPRVASAPGEEAGERGLLVAERLLERDEFYRKEPLWISQHARGGSGVSSPA